jgi:cell division protein FtsI/penicillin-binding protein 2
MKFLLIIILFFVFIGVLFGFSIFRFLFGRLFVQSHKQQQQTRNRQNKTQPKKQKKIIDSNEGEYIDYEEVKD